MKKWTRAALLAVGFSGFASLAFAAPGDGFAGSEHDGSAHGKPPCLNCHTPHQGKTTTLIWNHTLSVQTFTWDEPKTTAGTDFPTGTKGDTYTGMSVKCLSCHDGSVATTDGQWYNAEALPAGTFFVPDPYRVGASGDMSGTHPVMMPYPTNGVASTYNGVTNGPATNLAEWVPNPMATNNIRLYNDDGTGKITAGVVDGKTGIECGSCHDVHNGPTVTGLFLVRGTNVFDDTSSAAGGYICYQCHRK